MKVVAKYSVTNRIKAHVLAHTAAQNHGVMKHQTMTHAEHAHQLVKAEFAYTNHIDTTSQLFTRVSQQYIAYRVVIRSFIPHVPPPHCVVMLPQMGLSLIA